MQYQKQVHWTGNWGGGWCLGRCTSLIGLKGRGGVRRDATQCGICYGSVEMSGGMEGRLMRWGRGKKVGG